MIRDRQVTSREVVDAHLARIGEVNPSINAVTVTLAEEAREGAKAIDRAVAAGAPLGPLAGVPITVKENIDVAGAATTSAARLIPARTCGSIPRPTGSRTRAKRIRPLMGGLCRGAGTHRGSQASGALMMPSASRKSATRRPSVPGSWSLG
jgi:hypothetical protein